MSTIFTGFFILCLLFLPLPMHQEHYLEALTFVGLAPNPKDLNKSLPKLAWNFMGGISLTIWHVGRTFCFLSLSAYPEISDALPHAHHTRNGFISIIALLFLAASVPGFDLLIRFF